MLTPLIALLLLQSAAQSPAPASLGTQVVQVLPQENVALNVSLWAKWVAPAKVQFRIEAEAADAVKDPSLSHPTTKDADVYLRKLLPCHFGLELTGADGFPVGRVELGKTMLIDDEGLRTGFTGNGTIKMTLTGYRALVKSGGWSFAWDCPRY